MLHAGVVGQHEYEYVARVRSVASGISFWTFSLLYKVNSAYLCPSNSLPRHLPTIWLTSVSQICVPETIFKESSSLSATTALSNSSAVSVTSGEVVCTTTWFSAAGNSGQSVSEVYMDCFWLECLRSITYASWKCQFIKVKARTVSVLMDPPSWLVV